MIRLLRNLRSVHSGDVNWEMVPEARARGVPNGVDIRWLSQDGVVGGWQSGVVALDVYGADERGAWAWVQPLIESDERLNLLSITVLPASSPQGVAWPRIRARAGATLEIGELPYG